MDLDVIIPTYNREQLLQRTLKSLIAADMPDGLNVRVTVVDNNSKDGTRQVVQSWEAAFNGRLNYIFEKQQGRSSALNAGIAHTSGELIGMMDDDEEIDPQWYRTIFEAFQGGGVDFIGGPFRPIWGAECPDWLPMNYLGVIGWIDAGNEVRPYDESYPGILMGGNAVLTRRILDTVGPYLTSLGRTAKRLLAGEDEEMYQRLLAAGARGVYRPDLIIYHYIPPERLTKQYFRRWCFWRGVSVGSLSRDRTPDCPQIAGVPRYMYGEAARGMVRKFKESVRRQKDPGRRFAGELAVWDLAGFFYGKHFYKPAM